MCVVPKIAGFSTKCQTQTPFGLHPPIRQTDHGKGSLDGPTTEVTTEGRVHQAGNSCHFVTSVFATLTSLSPPSIYFCICTHVNASVLNVVVGVPHQFGLFPPFIFSFLLLLLQRLCDVSCHPNMTKSENKLPYTNLFPIVERNFLIAALSMLPLCLPCIVRPRPRL